MAGIAAVLLTTLPTAAQQLPMGQRLNTGSHQERMLKLASLGIEQDEAELAESRHDFAVLFLPCDGQCSASIHVLENGNSDWHITAECNSRVNVQLKPGLAPVVGG